MYNIEAQDLEMFVMNIKQTVISQGEDCEFKVSLYYIERPFLNK